MKESHSPRFTGIIPARYASSRFPGKPLAVIGGMTMIERVYRQASLVLEETWVATDDERIREAVTAFGGKVVMTSSEHRSGTDRCAEAAAVVTDGSEDTVIINIQGDEPFIRPEQIRALMDCFTGNEVMIATLIRRAEPDEDLFNPNHPKVIVRKNMDAICFSRSVIPFFRDSPAAEWSRKHTYYKHIGLYGYRASTLRELTLLPQSPLEKAESLEQMRWIENGYSIRCAVTPWESIGIDTPEDLDRAAKMLQEKLL
ncbi:MAG: 3-deoxy-manno-octulosonate cytidylyltransferase [Bacteroidales bacterium]|jgi:3-deoxy-manno-octulosonate cytidylyltransferase (CMP-KDO synthetase)|nr:3-deoxy-manno-octulosonate cytidylyltransferase [Bacteroidales bacterium]MDX9927362.1 3-deoxy-manno-octulosonate cytidylyltransferase [Bacteroidales bacterium]HNX83439.1 3-deoxy-manno-octulosonate cytidylyltransferase [Bacteroidales bacterium]HOC48787.1 3-deoxy-manno-octulosonate cytidylyltransferase [Bacteroidales bacterium]HPS97659.1 3-deoxy-manno-octulosonate cytidylyltransferase [Bacteroidales bacterium]